MKQRGSRFKVCVRISLRTKASSVWTRALNRRTVIVRRLCGLNSLRGSDMQLCELFKSFKETHARKLLGTDCLDHVGAQHAIAFKLRLTEPLIDDRILRKSLVAFVKIGRTD